MSLFSSNANIQPNEWNHIAFTYNKETSNVNLFVNNKIVNSTKLEIELTKSLSDFNIGYSSNINDGEAYFNGTIDEILLYNRELNPKELEYVSKSNNTDLFLKNLVAGRWSFDEFTTQVNNLLDNSGNNNTAVASGNVTRGSTPAFGNHSIAFDGSSKITAPNTSLHTGYMSVGAWIKPTAYGETFIKKEGVFDVGVSSDGFPKMTIGDVSSELTSVLEKKKTEEQQNILDTLTHVEQFSLQNYVIDNVTIGNNGITVNDKMYTTSGLGSVQSDGTYNYLEMSSGKLIVPAYTYITSPTTINNTYYFVVKAQDVNGSIARMTSATGDNFNIHVNHGSNTSVHPFNWPTNNNYIVSTTFAPKDSYIIIVLKILYKSANVYDARIQFIAKPDDGEYITAGYDQEILNMTSGSAINNDFDLGHGSLETSNFKLYEFGILDKYVTDIEFDEIVTYLKTKYYTPELLNQVVESPLVAHFALQNNTKDLTGLNSDAVGHNITYTTNSYNTYIGNTSVQLNGNDSYIDCGKVFQNVSDPNKMTLSMWVNMSELESDKKYPLMSSAGFEWYLNKPSSGTLDTYQNFEINVPIDFGVFATTWRITWTQEAAAGYMRSGEVGIYDAYYEPTFQHSPLAYTSINPSNWNVIYDGNAGQYNLQNNDGPYSYTITFQNAIQLKQLKLGSTDGGAGNSLTGHPSKSVKFEYQLENGSFVEHSTLIMKDITSGENGTETFNTNGGNYPWKVTETIYPLIGMYGMDMFRWNGSKWYHYQSYGDDMVINYPKPIGATTYY